LGATSKEILRDRRLPTKILGVTGTDPRGEFVPSMTLGEAVTFIAINPKHLDTSAAVLFYGADGSIGRNECLIAHRLYGEQLLSK
jgi:hypothetical protein